MVEIKRITIDDLKDIAARQKFNELLLIKDYYLTQILYLIKDIKGIYFKGGTAFQKIFFNHIRLSEDIDLTITKDVQAVINEVDTALNNCGLFGKITKDKNVEGFTRLVANYKIGENTGSVFIDINGRAKLILNPEKFAIKHFYSGFIPEFEFYSLSKEEMIAEKVAAAIGRNMPRDHFDIYQIIKAKMPINLELVKKKCSDSKVEFDIIKMFNKAQKLKNRWDEDLVPLLREEIGFNEVIKTLADHFKLKEEKASKKSKK